MAITTNNGQRDGVAPDINVTPLVDVVLVLLIIFMVVTPQLENDVQVDLPAIVNVDPESQQEYESIEISISRDGKYFLDDKEYALDVLGEELARLHAANPKSKLSLRADVGQGFGDIRKLFATVKDAGFKGAALVVSENKAAAKAPTPDSSAAAPGLRGDNARP